MYPTYGMPYGTIGSVAAPMIGSTYQAPIYGAGYMTGATVQAPVIKSDGEKTTTTATPSYTIPYGYGAMPYSYGYGMGMPYGGSYPVIGTVKKEGETITGSAAPAAAPYTMPYTMPTATMPVYGGGMPYGGMPYGGGMPYAMGSYGSFNAVNASPAPRQVKQAAAYPMTHPFFSGGYGGMPSYGYGGY